MKKRDFDMLMMYLTGYCGLLCLCVCVCVRVFLRACVRVSVLVYHVPYGINQVMIERIVYASFLAAMGLICI